MRIAGKCYPTEEELIEAQKRGFEYVELHLDRHHIDKLDNSLTAVRESPVEVVSVHTPHVTPNEKSYFRGSDRLADELNATLVVHSQYLHHTHIDELEAISFQSKYAYENIPGASSFHLENAILNQGYDLVLDNAHLYIAEPDYHSSFKNLLKNYSKQIPIVHLNDGTVLRDGMAFGHGDVDVRATFVSLLKEFDGTVVLEVMPEYQRKALTLVTQWDEGTNPDVQV